jgi:hypothetical protein
VLNDCRGRHPEARRLLDALNAIPSLPVLQLVLVPLR